MPEEKNKAKKAERNPAPAEERAQTGEANPGSKQFPAWAALAAILAVALLLAFGLQQLAQPKLQAPSATPTPIPTPCPEGTIIEKQCVGLYSGIQTWYECINGKWQSKSKQDVDECNINKANLTDEIGNLNTTPAEMPSAPAAQDYSSKTPAQIIIELRPAVESAIQATTSLGLKCFDNSIGTQRQFTCSGKREDGYVASTFKALNYGSTQKIPATKPTITLGGRTIAYEQQTVGNETQTINAYILCHANQTLLQFIVPLADDENYALTTALLGACPQ